MKDFKDRFGHCNIPQHWIENPSLGRWVIRQRVYKERLTEERIAMLDKIGFTWNIFDAVWEENYQELVLFKEKFGHGNVSKGQTEYLKLADWLQKQRKDKKQNEPRLTKYKIDKLDSLGIDWFFYLRHGWDNQFDELVQFQKKYGHCQVKRRSKEYSTLANWVAIQRKDKELLTDEQKTKLNSIGFIWSIKPRKNKVCRNDRSCV